MMEVRNSGVLRTIPFILIVVLSLLSWAYQVAGVVIYDADFDEERVGPLSTQPNTDPLPLNLPTNTIRDAECRVDVVASAGNLSNKPVLLDSVPGGLASAAFYNPSELTSSQWQISWDSLVLRTPIEGQQEQGNVHIVAEWQGHLPCVWGLRYNPYGDFLIRDADGFHSIGSFTVGVSDHFDLHLDLDNKTYVLDINGSSILSGQLIEPGEFRHVYFRSNGRGSSEDLAPLAFDNLLVIPESATFLPSYTKYSGGTGEPNDPYLIYTAEQLNAIGAEPNDCDKHFKLMADIDLSKYKGTDFNIIGYWVDWDSPDNRPFRGVFDGNGHTISNFNYNSTDKDGIGLFRYVTGVIKDLGLVDPNVDAGTANYVGSLVGWLRWGTITNCYVEGGSVSGEDNIGGIVGRNWGTIINCYANGSVMGNGYVGGMGGYNLGTITNCCAGSVVIGNKNVGGMVGRHGCDYSYDSPWFPPTSPDLGRDPVFLGPGDKISNCYSTSDVSGGDRVGGLAGEQTLGSMITNCYSTGRVSGNADVGGLVGAIAFPPPPLIDLYGITPDTISDFYSTADITGNGGDGQIVGGFIPDVNSFWDTETSGQHTSALGIGKTTAEMQTASTFLYAGWDFVGETANGTEDIWWILEGQDYPRLIWELPEGLRLQPLPAFSPNPQDGATDVTPSPILHWAPAEPTLQHDIYLGEDKEEVANATTLSSGIYRSRQPGELTTYEPRKLEWDATYYWRIDEVNEADTNSLCKGSVWSFTTANFLIVDDFESYNAYETADPNSNSILNPITH
jgi:hypothetical protein